MRTKLSRKHASVLHIKGPHNIAEKWICALYMYILIAKTILCDNAGYF